MARTGRPKSEKARSEVLNFRLTPEEKVDLEQYAAKHGLTKTQTVMKGVQYLMDADNSDVEFAE